LLVAPRLRGVGLLSDESLDGGCSYRGDVSGVADDTVADWSVISFAESPQW